MSHTSGPFLGPREELTGFTWVGPRAIYARLREMSERLGISRHVLAALAIDEYLRRHDVPDHESRTPVHAEASSPAGEPESNEGQVK